LKPCSNAKITGDSTCSPENIEEINQGKESAEYKGAIQVLICH